MHFVCRTCATQFAQQLAQPSEPPERCPICEDERQYVGADGQQWTTLDELSRDHRCEVREDAGYLGVGVEPSFAIGQRLLLAETPEGNVLWDMIPLVDDGSASRQCRRGERCGRSRSRTRTTTPGWSSGARRWEASRSCSTRPTRSGSCGRIRAIELWSGDVKELWAGLTLLRLGGHYPGGTVLHDRERRTLLSGDILQVIPDRRYVSFMWSYPNLIPLPGAEVLRIAAALEPYPFDRILGAWWDRLVPRDGNEVVRRSAERYAAALAK